MAIRDLLPARKKDRYPTRKLEEEGSLASFQQEINRLFDEFFSSFGAPLARSWGSGAAPERSGVGSFGTFVPRIDVSEDDREVKIVAELPGMDEKDVNVELENNLLILRGEKKDEREEKEGAWHRVECSYGSFRRLVPLPAGIDADKARAKFKKGRLSVAIPKTSEARESRKSIAIDAG
jgi:HSP20 family protein